jgi:hypothetical protein
MYLLPLIIGQTLTPSSRHMEATSNSHTNSPTNSHTNSHTNKEMSVFFAVIEPL